MPLYAERVLCLHDFDDPIVAPSRGLEKGARVRYGLMVVRVDLVHAFEYLCRKGAFPNLHLVSHRTERRPLKMGEMPVVARRRRS